MTHLNPNLFWFFTLLIGVTALGLNYLFSGYGSWNMCRGDEEQIGTSNEESRIGD